MEIKRVTTPTRLYGLRRISRVSITADGDDGDDDDVDDDDRDDDGRWW